MTWFWWIITGLAGLAMGLGWTVILLYQRLELERAVWERERVRLTGLIEEERLAFLRRVDMRREGTHG